MRVLITDNDLGDSELEIDVMRGAMDVEVIVRSSRTEQEVLEAVLETDPHGIVVQWAPITRAVLSAASACRGVSRIGVGLDMVDLDAARECGIPVRNVPHYCTEEVATHAVALGLALWRRLTEFDGDVRAGRWEPAATVGSIRRLSESTVGVVGMGRIGRTVADAYAQWGATVVACDPVHRDDPYERIGLDELADRSDLISLHAPLTSETHHLVGDALLDRCTRRPILVNVSRGGLHDSAAVARALVDGRLGGAGLDVFETEPLPMSDPILSAPRTILTPHAAWCSQRALPELRRLAAENMVALLAATGPSHSDTVGS